MNEGGRSLTDDPGLGDARLGVLFGSSRVRQRIEAVVVRHWKPLSSVKTRSSGASGARWAPSGISGGSASFGSAEVV